MKLGLDSRPRNQWKLWDAEPKTLAGVKRAPGSSRLRGGPCRCGPVALVALTHGRHSPPASCGSRFAWSLQPTCQPSAGPGRFAEVASGPRAMGALPLGPETPRRLVTGARCASRACVGRERVRGERPSRSELPEDSVALTHSGEGTNAGQMGQRWAAVDAVTRRVASGRGTGHIRKAVKRCRTIGPSKGTGRSFSGPA